MNFHLLPPTCTCTLVPPYAQAEVGGRRCRQPGQIRKEAATTISCRVAGFHLLVIASPVSAFGSPRTGYAKQSSAYGLPRRYAPRNDDSEAVNQPCERRRITSSRARSSRIHAGGSS